MYVQVFAYMSMCVCVCACLLTDECTTCLVAWRSFSISLKWVIFNSFATVCLMLHKFPYIINHCPLTPTTAHRSCTNSLISFCDCLTHLCTLVHLHKHKSIRVCACVYCRHVYYSHASALNLCVPATTLKRLH